MLVFASLEANAHPLPKFTFHLRFPPSHMPPSKSLNVTWVSLPFCPNFEAKLIPVFITQGLAVSAEQPELPKGPLVTGKGHP